MKKFLGFLILVWLCQNYLIPDVVGAIPPIIPIYFSNVDPDNLSSFCYPADCIYGTENNTVSPYCWKVWCVGGSNITFYYNTTDYIGFKAELQFSFNRVSNKKALQNWSWSIVHNTYEHIQSLIVNWVFCIPIRQAFTPFFTITQANTSITIARSYGDLPIDDNDSTIQINVWELDQIGDTECNSSDLQRWGPIVNIVFEDLSTTESELIAPTTGKSTSFPEPIYKKQVPSSHLGVFLHYIWAPVIGLICAILLGLLVRYKKNVKEVGHHRLP